MAFKTNDAAISDFGRGAYSKSCHHVMASLNSSKLICCREMQIVIHSCHRRLKQNKLGSILFHTVLNDEIWR